MDEKELKNITVLIAGRPYPLRVEEADEASIRQIAKEVNEKISNFQLNYNKKDKQDCLSMALLTYAVDLHKWRTGKQQLENQETNSLNSFLTTLLFFQPLVFIELSPNYALFTSCIWF